MNKIAPALIWDCNGSPPPGSWSKVLLWRNFSQIGVDNIISIPANLERHAEDVRSRYLSWVYELSTIPIEGIPLCKRLEIREGFSFWWMSSIAEKCNYSKSKHINEALKLIELSFYSSKEINSKDIVLATKNLQLAECIQAWATRNSLNFQLLIQPESNKLNLFNLKKLRIRTPKFIFGIYWLIKYCFDRYCLKGLGLEGWKKSSARISFVSYLFNLNKSRLDKAVFESPYWGSLPDSLGQNKIKQNWLHIYVGDAVLPNPRSVREAIQSLNVNNPFQCHTVLETFLSIRIVIKSILDWVQLVAISIKITHKIEACLKEDQKFLWPLFRDEWNEIFLGEAAISNLMNMNLLDSAFAEIPIQDKCFYLQENQGWESALAYSWRRHGHYSLIGVPHSTIRFWDLRYFNDPRFYKQSDCAFKLLPDSIACNGPLASNVLVKAGYDDKKIINVEALRFLHLNSTLSDQNNLINKNDTKLKLLVLTDFLFENTHAQLNLLVEALKLLPNSISIIVKPHPYCLILKTDYEDLNFEITHRPLAELLGGFDLIYSSCATSASVEAYCVGLPIACHLDPCEVNLSPLRGFKDVCFVSQAQELSIFLTNSCMQHGMIEATPASIFNIDVKLSSWMKLIGSADNAI